MLLIAGAITQFMNHSNLQQEELFLGKIYFYIKVLAINLQI